MREIKLKLQCSTKSQQLCDEAGIDFVCVPTLILFSFINLYFPTLEGGKA